MALTGLQIQKLLPGTNCKECGSNTCLAFAMKLAGKKAELSECPYASDEAKRVLGEASEPPVRTIGLGADRGLLTGGETVVYRHEKTFVNRTMIAVNLNDTDDATEVEAVIRAVAGYRYDRVGKSFGIDMTSVTHTGGAPGPFLDLVKKVLSETGKPVVLRGNDPAVLSDASRLAAGSHSILCAASPGDANALLDSAREHGHAICVTAPDLDALRSAASSLRDAGFTDVILRFDTLSLSEHFQVNSLARRAAIKENDKPFGFPFLRFVDSGSPLEDTVLAVTEIVKYGGIVVLPRFDAAQMSSLLTMRLNIYTDPQNPIQVEPKLYPIGEPGADSPVFVTTNFSLTYFVVSAEIENSGISAWLLVPECEGMSVLTAWAAGKFNAGVIAGFAKQIGLEDHLKRRDIVIPGYVSQISGELEEELPGWKVLIGPQEAADLESFIKSRLAG